MIPANATALIAMVHALLPTYWPAHPMPDALPAQAEQESCAALTSKMCMSPMVENHNPKNNGEVGLGVFQLTKTNSFNNFLAVQKLSPELKGWQWADRHNLRKQVLAGILMDKGLYTSCSKLMAPGVDTYACAMSSYNGGFGGFSSSRRLCSNTKGCNPKVWFANVETASTTRKAPLPGYRLSAYQINRGYVQQIINVRRAKYAPYFEVKK
jgi:hypothetical protein